MINVYNQHVSTCTTDIQWTPCSAAQVLSYGIWTAAVLRLVMILLGSELIESWKPVLLLFAGILLFSSFKLLTGGKDDGDDEDLSDNGVVKLCRFALASQTPPHTPPPPRPDLNRACTLGHGFVRSILILDRANMFIEMLQ